MLWLWTGLAILGGIVFLVLIAALICFFRAFYAPRRRALGADEYDIPDGKLYGPYRDEMIGWVKMTRSLPHEKVEITSHDGLTLRGRYYECQAGAPIELLFHGYRGTAERDLSGGVERCFALGRNVLLIDQRAGGTSDGHVITFGIRERLDCLRWVEYAVGRFGKDVKLILAGVSMGAATVMMAAGEASLPENVVCVVADCGYSSPREIIQKVVRDMGVPVWLLYPFICLGARLFGGFDLEETSPMEAMARCRVPVIFFHGDADDFVPCEMSERLYAACGAVKKLVSVHGAGHGLAYPVDKEGYLHALREFQRECKF